ncbi:MAG: hypothetical protein WBG92_23715 [Thiohalocapsa sp.]
MSTLKESISMIEQYVDSEAIIPLVGLLREMLEKPVDDVLLARLSEIVDNLGVLQGAVLTYAPAIAGLLSDDPFGITKGTRDVPRSTKAKKMT